MGALKCRLVPWIAPRIDLGMDGERHAGTGGIGMDRSRVGGRCR
jgi:hypothetical protein